MHARICTFAPNFYLKDNEKRCLKCNTLFKQAKHVHPMVMTGYEVVGHFS